MSLENANYIQELIQTNPTGSDPLNQGDDHVRMVKKCLLNSLPNMTGPWKTSDRINAADPVDPQDLVTLAFLQANPSIPAVGWPFMWLLEDLPVVTGCTFIDLDGQELDRIDYAALYALFGVKYGIGNGTTTFNVPDMRGFFMRVIDDGAGLDPGPRVARPDGANLNTTPGTTQQDDFKAHTHVQNWTATAYGANAGGAHFVENSPSPYSTGSTGGAETRPKNFAIRMIMRAK